MSGPDLTGITLAEYQMARILAAGEACYPEAKPRPGLFTATRSSPP